ncbi:MAG: hypothetical protein AB7U95_37525 [Reyranella sp.]
MSRKNRAAEAAVVEEVVEQVAADVEADEAHVTAVAAPSAPDKDADGTAAIATIEALIGQRLLKKLHEEITNLPDVWQRVSEAEQARIIERMRQSVETAVRAAVSGIASAGFAWAPAALESLTIKDGAKATLILSRGTEAMHEFADRVGSPVVVVFADPKEYLEEMHEIRAQADQPSLPLEQAA